MFCFRYVIYGVADDDEKEEFQAMFVYCLDGDTGEEEWSMTTELGFMVRGRRMGGGVLFCCLPYFFGL